MTVHFSCTQCGRCCHGLRLPLSVEEAITWLRDGGAVQLFSEAIPWPEELPEDNLPAQHKRRRSFAARSGSLPVRVIVVLMASFDGACPNLLPDMRCGIYDRRPRVCRIYPAELNPFVELEPAGKLCPPEAWQSGEVLRDEAGRWTDPDTVAAIAATREADRIDAATKARVCERLGHAVAGLSNEGIVILSPPRERLLAALEEAVDPGASEEESIQSWQVLSNRMATLDMLRSAGTDSAVAPDADAGGLRYMGFFQGDASPST